MIRQKKTCLFREAQSEVILFALRSSIAPRKMIKFSVTSQDMSHCTGLRAESSHESLKYRPCRSEDLVQFWSCVWSGWRMGCSSVWQSDRLYPSKSDYNCYYSCICHFIQNQWRWFMSMSTGSAWTSLTKRRASCQSANSFARWTATVSQPFPSLLVCQQDAVEVISSKDFSLCKQHVFLLQMQSEAALLVLLQYIASREIIKFSESCYGVFAQKCP